MMVRSPLSSAWVWPMAVLLLAGGAALGEQEGAGAGAQQGVEADASAESVTDATLLRQHVAVLTELADEDYATRVRATERLLTDDSLELEPLRELYRRAETPEQRHRLLDVARHHTIRQMRERIFERADRRGSIGITFDPRPREAAPDRDRPAVMVVRSMPGFPAYGRLRAGDLLLALDGEPLAGTDQDFKDRVQAHRRGDTVTFTLLRDGERIERKVSLASIQALESVYERSDHLGGDAGLRLSPPFRNQWESVRDELQRLGPEPTPLRVAGREPGQGADDADERDAD